MAALTDKEMELSQIRELEIRRQIQGAIDGGNPVQELDLQRELAKELDTRKSGVQRGAEFLARWASTKAKQGVQEANNIAEVASAGLLNSIGFFGAGGVVDHTTFENFGWRPRTWDEITEPLPGTDAKEISRGGKAVLRGAQFAGEGFGATMALMAAAPNSVYNSIKGTVAAGLKTTPAQKVAGAIRSAMPELWTNPQSFLATEAVLSGATGAIGGLVSGGNSDAQLGIDTIAALFSGTVLTATQRAAAQAKRTFWTKRGRARRATLLAQENALQHLRADAAANPAKYPDLPSAERLVLDQAAEGLSRKSEGVALQRAMAKLHADAAANPRKYPDLAEAERALAASVASAMESRTILGEPTVGMLTENVGLIGLEQLLANKGAREDILRSRASIEKAVYDQIKTVGGPGTTDEMVQAIRVNHERFSGLLENAVKAADLEARNYERLLPPAEPEAIAATSDRFLANQLDAITVAARDHESAAWTAALQGADIDLSEVQDIVNAAERTAAVSHRKFSPLPKELQQTIDELAEDAGGLLGGAPLAQIQALRSDILRQKRINNSSKEHFSPNLNDRLNQIDAGLLSLLEKSATDKDALDNARKISVKLNDTLTRGPIGNALKYDVSGPATVDGVVTAGLNTDHMLALSGLFARGLSGRLGGEALNDVINMASARFGQEYADTMATTVDDYIRSRFAIQARKAFDDPAIDPARAETFLTSYESFLQSFPKVRAELIDIMRGRRNLDDAITKQKVSMEEYNKSQAAMFLGFSEPEAVMRANNLLDQPGGFKEMYGSVKDNPAALAGFKSLFAKAWLRRLQRTTENALTGQLQLSEAKAQALLRDYSDKIELLYGAKGLETARQIKDSLVAAINPEKYKVSTRSDTTENMAANILTEKISRMVGSVIARKLPFGGTLQVASAGAEIGEMAVGSVGERNVFEMLKHAMMDPTLMDDMLRAPTRENYARLRKNYQAKFPTIAAIGIEDIELPDESVTEE